MKFLQKIKEIFSIDNLILIICLIATGIAGFLGVQNNNVGQVQSAILAMIVAFAVSQIMQNIKNNYELKNLNHEIKSTLKKTGNVEFLLGRKGLPHLSERVEQAKDIILIGRTLALVLRDTDFFIRVINSNVKLRLLFMNPLNKELVKLVEPTLDLKKALPLDLQTTLSMIEQIKASIKNTDLLECRVMDYPPSLNIAIVHTHNQEDNVFAEILAYDVKPNERVGFLCYKKNAITWFEYFNNIAEKQWRESSLIQLSKNVEEGK
ncbi:MAG: hypothetical protein Q8K60_03480 [Parachlamydiaceae bacterium]|nr:hypothetical protein [Parachlamydiaceae bacterium]